MGGEESLCMEFNGETFLGRASGCLHSVRCVCVCCTILNGAVFPHEGDVKMGTFSLHVGTMPEGRNRFDSEVKNHDSSSRCAVHARALMHVKVGSGGI